MDYLIQDVFFKLYPFIWNFHKFLLIKECFFHYVQLPHFYYILISWWAAMFFLISGFHVLQICYKFSHPPSLYPNSVNLLFFSFSFNSRKFLSSFRMYFGPLFLFNWEFFNFHKFICILLFLELMYSILVWISIAVMKHGHSNSYSRKHFIWWVMYSS